MKPNKSTALKLWSNALAHIESTDPESLEWARSVGPETFANLKSKGFLGKYCYVVYASGFKASTIQSYFPDLQKAFKEFDLKELAHMRSIRKPLEVFGNERKASNFLRGAQAIGSEGYSAFKLRLLNGGADVLEQLPGIGPITKLHLAKNIGLLDVAKADIWLVKAAAICGFGDVQEFVELLHKETGESRHVVDVVIWTLGKDEKFEDRKK